MNDVLGLELSSKHYHNDAQNSTQQRLATIYTSADLPRLVFRSCPRVVYPVQCFLVSAKVTFSNSARLKTEWRFKSQDASCRKRFCAAQRLDSGVFSLRRV